jgi:hypothetical protein
MDNDRKGSDTKSIVSGRDCQSVDNVGQMQSGVGGWLRMGGI